MHCVAHVMIGGYLEIAVGVFFFLLFHDTGFVKRVLMFLHVSDFFLHILAIINIHLGTFSVKYLRCQVIVCLKVVF